jgi:copper chaperone CopZ
MNYLKIFSLLTITLIMSCKSDKSVDEESKSITAIEIPVEKYNVKIEGMTCTGCEQTIQNVVSGFEGIKKVEASYEKGYAIIEAEEGKLDTLAIKEKVSESGYQILSFNTLPE